MQYNTMEKKKKQKRILKQNAQKYGMENIK